MSSPLGVGCSAAGWSARGPGRGSALASGSMDGPLVASGVPEGPVRLWTLLRWDQRLRTGGDLRQRPVQQRAHRGELLGDLMLQRPPLQLAPGGGDIGARLGPDPLRLVGGLGQPATRTRLATSRVRAASCLCRAFSAASSFCMAVRCSSISAARLSLTWVRRSASCASSRATLPVRVLPQLVEPGLGLLQLDAQRLLGGPPLLLELAALARRALAQLVGLGQGEHLGGAGGGPRAHVVDLLLGDPHQMLQPLIPSTACGMIGKSDISARNRSTSVRSSS